jgi:hypothetical protein
MMWAVSQVLYTLLVRLLDSATGFFSTLDSKESRVNMITCCCIAARRHLTCILNYTIKSSRRCALPSTGQPRHRGTTLTTRRLCAAGDAHSSSCGR